MKYIEYREKREHGTREFPCAFYHVTEIHPRYNMIHHWHNECELIFVHSGKLEISVDGKDRVLNEGESTFIIGGFMHGAMPYNCIYDCVVFDAASLVKCSQSCAAQVQPMLNREKSTIPVFPAESEPSKLLRAICEILANKNTGYELYAQGQLLCLLGSIIRNNYFLADSELPASDLKKISKFKKVLSYIEEHYREPITLEELANQCGMNRNYFCRAFKEYTKKTPVEYLNYYRIESACEQIVSTDEKLINIAMNCGFNDYSYFIKVFKSQKGVTPRDYCRKSF